jgi:hypothetical protein
MMALVPLLLCAGVDVISVHDVGKDEKAIRATLASKLGPRALDATAIHQKIFRLDGPLPFNDFEAFTATPPSGWPDALKDAWTSSVAHCAALAGPPPLRAGSATCCSMRLATFLWSRYLGKVGATRSVEVSESNDVEGCTSSVVVIDAKARKVVTRSGACADVAGVLADALAGKGSAQAWELWEEIGTPLDGDPFSGRKASVQKVELKNACATAPGALSIAGSSTIGRALTERWAASVPPGGQPRSCTLEQSLHVEPTVLAMLPGMHVVSAIVHCGDATAGAEAALEIGPGPDVITRDLVAALAAKLCH